jgi:ssDNA-binding Zn-finger/Zn-ribbon topoisomerase 1
MFQKNKSPGYVYICKKNPEYDRVGKDKAFATEKLLNDDATCPSCSISFGEFRKGEGVKGREGKHPGGVNGRVIVLTAKVECVARLSCP